MSYKCVNCGVAATALYKTYGPSVLKLTKCETCKGTVDKYIEYDPVIITIDLILISKEAQRHIIYNTEFKSFWKLLIILALLETYGVWHNDSLFSIAVNNLCDIQNNSTVNTTYLSIPPTYLPEPWSECVSWRQGDKEDADVFIWEKDFYVQFLATAAGNLVFLLNIYAVMTLMRKLGSQKVCSSQVVRGATLAAAHGALALPQLVWGTNASPHTRLLHYTLVWLYGVGVYSNMLTVLYEGPRLVTIPLLVISNLLKFVTIFHMSPIIRRVLT
ncbi:protein ARV1 isoform X2 [Aricia agestis]|uniref:protein ARV1 isoform X2 n=1 Tax=Aricia agestis TaxID=91739 RepID=UPI001C206E8E|nr:protein ARV1 isoform X2 [Aricia agestis]